jgi:hypothetical protein
VKVYVVRNLCDVIHGVYANQDMAHKAMIDLLPKLACTQEIEVQQSPTWTVWSKPNSCEAKSATLNERMPADFKVMMQLEGVRAVNVSANDIKEAIDVGESAFRMHQISNQQEDSK